MLGKFSIQELEGDSTQSTCAHKVIAPTPALTLSANRQATC
jgi:hypothetical protein